MMRWIIDQLFSMNNASKKFNQSEAIERETSSLGKSTIEIAQMNPTTKKVFLK